MKVGTEGKGILILKRKYIADSIQEETKFNALDTNLFPNYTLIADTINTDNGLTSNWVKKIKINNSSAWIATYSSGIIEIPFHSKSGDISEERIYYGTENGITYSLKESFVVSDIVGIV